MDLICMPYIRLLSLNSLSYSIRRDTGRLVFSCLRVLARKLLSEFTLSALINNYLMEGLEILLAVINSKILFMLE